MMAGDHTDGARYAARANRLLEVLDAGGMVEAADVRSLAEQSMRRHGLANGQRIVARAWLDPDFRDRLLTDGTAAAAELGYEMARGFQSHVALRVVANTPEEHNLVVCTLCSCYPIAILGPPPSWYKYEAYRSRAVRDPRGVIEEFGLRLPPEARIRVWDSSSEIRYMVLPQRPAGTDGLGEEALAELVTQESIIGTGVPRAPATDGARPRA